MATLELAGFCAASFLCGGLCTIATGLLLARRKIRQLRGGW